MKYVAVAEYAAALTPGNICLGSAHDNMPTYRLLEYFNINALIDLNMRGSSTDGIPEGFSLDKDGLRSCHNPQNATWQQPDPYQEPL